MKKSVKIGLGGLVLLMGTMLISGCTASFCTLDDKAHMLYMFDPGVTVYTGNATRTVTKDDGTEEAVANTPLQIEGVDVSNVYYYVDLEANTYLKKIRDSVTKSNLSFPTLNYWAAFDKLILEKAVREDGTTKIDNYLQVTSARDPEEYRNENYGILDVYGYLKYGDDVNEKGRKLWSNWDNFNDIITKDAYAGGATYGVQLDEVPTVDFVKQYKKSMNSYIAGYRSCLALKTAYYGAYGPNNLPIEISGKKITDWKGLLEFLFVWPIGAFVDVLTTGMIGGGVANGAAQLLAILIVTFVIRALMLLVTFKSTKTTAKMNELQPELQRIQAKYPNANTNNYERQRLAAETQKLYKKYGVNPLSSLLVMIVQFPIFICVWGALQGSAWLSTGSFLGLRLSSSISSVLFSAAAWRQGGAVTALILFLLMSGAQVVAMLLPQWIQKSKSKNVAKLGRNPAQKQNSNRMKWFTYIMLGMIIFMGFSLASAMGVYWLVGAIFSICQTLIMEAINNRHKNKKKGAK